MRQETIKFLEKKGFKRNVFEDKSGEWYSLSIKSGKLYLRILVEDFHTEDKQQEIYTVEIKTIDSPIISLKNKLTWNGVYVEQGRFTIGKFNKIISKYRCNSK